MLFRLASEAKTSWIERKPRSTSRISGFGEARRFTVSPGLVLEPLPDLLEVEELVLLRRVGLARDLGHAREVLPEELRHLHAHRDGARAVGLDDDRVAHRAGRERQRAGRRRRRRKGILRDIAGKVSPFEAAVKFGLARGSGKTVVSPPCRPSTILPLGKTVAAENGASLRDVLQQAGILLDYPCGGKGTCRQCRVTDRPGPGVGQREAHRRGERGRGAPRLPDHGRGGLHRDRSPEERLSKRVWKLGMRDRGRRARPVGSGSLRRVRVALAAPSLEDQRSDWERLAAGLAASGHRGRDARAPTARGDLARACAGTAGPSRRSARRTTSCGSTRAGASTRTASPSTWAPPPSTSPCSTWRPARGSAAGPSSTGRCPSAPT